MICVLLLAAGFGIRSGVLKQYKNIANLNENLISICLRKFLRHDMIKKVKVVINEKHLDFYHDSIIKFKYNEKLLPYCIGGESRKESVYNGLISLQDIKPTKVLIHDVARPFIRDNVISDIIEKLNENDIVDLVSPVNDTIRYISKKIYKTISRDKIFLSQTPQGFNYELILALHKKYRKNHFTDDVSLCIKENSNNLKKTTLINISDNSKITMLEDFNKFTIKQIRTGLGTDIHKIELTEQEKEITLAGIKINCFYDIIAHSDGDVIFHAITEALLGAIAEGNIGTHFPNTDEKYKNCSSSIFLLHAINLVEKKNYLISNIDVTVICEEPKIMKHSFSMRQNISTILKINLDQISIKATTNEKIGFIGRKEGIAAQAVCTLILLG